ncbi:DUF1963 domain-containing protein [Nocardia sp. XZ_19_385]|uniref:DUF1963 domain-containing protein n=1 Tax=Nocardia sp. XZ_19_385 TaxID=2769488 RepID=UPI00188F61A3|nr:DUF1963 domain-containing protein [Nocardia sp. XZ_19_385]
MTEPDLRALMRLHIPEEFHADMELAVRDSLRLRHASAGDKVIGYFGGLPELPDGFAWPGADHGHYEHVASIDLAELPKLDLNLPASGRISVFGDTNGWSGAFLFFPPEVELRETPLPPDLAERNRIIRRTDMTFAMVPSIPDGQWLEEHLLGSDDYDDEVYERFEAFSDTYFEHSWAWHQLGGWANEIQSDHDRGLLPGTAAYQHFYGDRQPSGQILLVQFDTDPEIGMGWGDFGTLYCFVAPQALAAHDFTDVRVHWECY